MTLSSSSNSGSAEAQPRHFSIDFVDAEGHNDDDDGCVEAPSSDDNTPKAVEYSFVDAAVIEACKRGDCQTIFAKVRATARDLFLESRIRITSPQLSFSTQTNCLILFLRIATNPERATLTAHTCPLNNAHLNNTDHPPRPLVMLCSSSLLPGADARGLRCVLHLPRRRLRAHSHCCSSR